jgi:hypothetical protein
MLDGGMNVTISSSGNQSANSPQGVHVIGDYPSDGSADPVTSGSAGSWSTVAENGGQTLASLSSESLALCLTPSLSVPSTAAGGQTITVSWADVASPTSTDWIGLYAAGNTGTSYLDWFYAGSCSQTAGSAENGTGSCSYTLPATAGTYDFILYTDNSYTVLATSNTVTVSGAPTLSVPSTASGGQTITVSWSGVASPASTDWIGLYEAGQTGNSYLDWFYAGSCTQTAGSAETSSGSCSYTLPNDLAAGNYDFILNNVSSTNGQSNPLATSNTVAVS